MVSEELHTKWFVYYFKKNPQKQLIEIDYFDTTTNKIQSK